MGFEYSISYEHPYVEVRVRGEADYLSTDRMWKEISATCRNNDCRKVLGIAHIEARTAEHAYDHAAIFEAAGITTEYRIAWVENNRSDHETAKLVETVIRNRGLADGRVFDDVREARRWLLESDTP